MHKLLARQTAKATSDAGELDIHRLLALVGEVYDQLDKDRTRSARATRLMIAEVDAHDKARQAALDRLADQNRILEATIAHMVQGVAMFDADHRLVLSNARYAEIYNLPPALAVVGTPFAEIVDHHVQRDFQTAETPDDLIHKLPTAGDAIRYLDDGRIIAVSRLAMPNGGWVTTHDDITERERLHGLLKQQHTLVKRQQEELQAKNTQFDAAINNMSEGILLL